MLRQPSASISITAPACGGTLQWMAPELFRDNSCLSKASDVYALGMVIYEVGPHCILHESVLKDCFCRLSHTNGHSLMFVITLCLDLSLRENDPQILGLSKEVWALTVKCWDGDPSIWPHITDILSLFEAVSRRWVSSTSEAITKLGLNLPTAQKPTTRESTFTTSGLCGGMIGPGASVRTS